MIESVFCKRNFFLLLCLYILLSCFEKSRLKKVLASAGKNRAELKKVLDHYKEGSLKYKAAVFLIENMSGHFYRQDNPELLAMIDSLNRSDLNPDEIQIQLGSPQKTTSFSFSLRNKFEDIETLSSEFLTPNSVHIS